jgi:hypothetical protein
MARCWNSTFIKIIDMTDYKAYCNMCGYETNHDDDGCVYHQKTLVTSDGESYQRYDEFNQDGEEW